MIASITSQSAPSLLLMSSFNSFETLANELYIYPLQAAHSTKRWREPVLAYHVQDYVEGDGFVK